MPRWGVGFGDRPGQDANAIGPRETGADPRDFDFPTLEASKGMKGPHDGDSEPASESTAPLCDSDVEEPVVAEVDTIAAASDAELRQRAERDGGADDDGDDDAFMELRRRRIAELRQRRQQQQEEMSKPQGAFGELQLLPTQDAYREAVMEIPEGVFVVCLLTADNDKGSDALRAALSAVARAHTDVRFVAARAATAVPTLPAEHLPTVLVRCGGGGSSARQIAGMRPWGGLRPSPRDAAAVLRDAGVPLAQEEQAAGDDCDDEDSPSHKTFRTGTASKFSIV
eukprot:TRINITY_DN37_c0_g2_i1.p1 TRINITY_DN37_c0_g2~~TRINITY_DN37_c0_g2_i1.p1  ORF type:complete len:283 (+),score=123.78 TRINITY_DN37_c0_g2_i1:61-909(+)